MSKLVCVDCELPKGEGEFSKRQWAKGASSSGGSGGGAKCKLCLGVGAVSLSSSKVGDVGAGAAASALLNTTAAGDGSAERRRAAGLLDSLKQFANVVPQSMSAAELHEVLNSGGGSGPSSAFRSLCARQFDFWHRLQPNAEKQQVLDTGADFIDNLNAALGPLDFPLPFPLQLGDFDEKCHVLEFVNAKIQAHLLIAHRKTECPVAPDKTSGSELLDAIGAFVLEPNEAHLAAGNANALLDLVTERVQSWLSQLSARARADSTTALLRRADYTAEQLAVFEQFNQSLRQQFEQRRTMLIKRADVTLQSFLWASEAARHAEPLAEIVDRLRAPTTSRTQITLDDAFLATRALLRLHAVSSAAAHGNAAGKPRLPTGGAAARPRVFHPLKSLVIPGSVPDRGGRPMEMKNSAAARMPAFRKREAVPSQSEKARPKKTKPNAGSGAPPSK